MLLPLRMPCRPDWRLCALLIGLCVWDCGLETAVGSDQSLAVRQSGDSVSVNVETGGCTTQKDFTVAQVVTGNPATVILKRNSPDRCKGWFPEGVWIAFPKSDLGISGSEPVRVFERKE
jgi:hypothetical protein